MKNVLTLFLFFYGCGMAISQTNVISNSGFESKDWGVNDEEPERLSHLRKADTWKEDQKCPWDEYNTCGHSPDWLKIGSDHVHFLTVNAIGDEIPIPAHGGTGYLGFGCGDNSP